MNLRSLPTEAYFRFVNNGDPSVVWVYYGNGWYGRPYSGGPWHLHDDPEVIVVDENDPHYSQVARIQELREESYA